MNRARWVANYLVGRSKKSKVVMPHCDSRVLHSPGECHYCDQYPDAQYLRIQWGINFTGHHDPEFLLCPSEVDRNLGAINAWAGNVAIPELTAPTKEELEKAVAVLLEVVREME